MKTHALQSERPCRWRLTCLLALAALFSSRAALAEDAPAPSAAAPDKKDAALPAAEEEHSYVNYATMGLGGNAVSGNVAEFQRRTGVPQGVYGGIQDFHYERALDKKTTFRMDARAIFGNEDYGVRLELVNPDKGFVRAGYKQFRTYFNGDGGYFPGGATASQQWIPLPDNDLHLDRSEVWVEAGLTLPDWPEITFGYNHQEREGEKSSTIWGPAALTTVNGSVARRSILPTFYTIDETRDLFRLDARKSFEKVDLNLGLRYDMFNASNSRNSSQQLGGPLGNGFMTTQEGQDANMFNVHASAETRLRENLLFTVGYAYTDLKDDVTGYRVYGTGYDADLAQRLPNPNTFQDLVGQTQLHQNVANLNFMWTVAENLYVVPSFRLESMDRSGNSTSASPAAPFAPSVYEASSDRGLTDIYENLELRYTGLVNWGLYARAQFMQGWGDLEESWANLSTATPFLARTTDDDRTAQKYTVGASWYPSRKLQLGVEYYYKQRNNDYSHPVDSTSNLPGSPIRYPAYLLAQQFSLNDVNARITWRARPNLTLVLREDIQWATIETQPAYLGEQQTADTTSYVTGASLSWTPWSRLYLQGNLNYVIDQTETPAASYSPSTPASENDYWTVTATAGFVVDNDTDLQVTYTHYRADNYIPTQWVDGLPYGAGGTEDVISASVTHRFSKRVSASLRYGYFTSSDETSGGYNDFQSQMVYSSLEYRF